MDFRQRARPENTRAGEPYLRAGTDAAFPAIAGTRQRDVDEAVDNASRKGDSLTGERKKMDQKSREHTDREPAMQDGSSRKGDSLTGEGMKMDQKNKENTDREPAVQDDSLAVQDLPDTADIGQPPREGAGQERAASSRAPGALPAEDWPELPAIEEDEEPRGIRRRAYGAGREEEAASSPAAPSGGKTAQKGSSPERRRTSDHRNSPGFGRKPDPAGAEREPARIRREIRAGGTNQEKAGAQGRTAVPSPQASRARKDGPRTQSPAASASGGKKKRHRWGVLALLLVLLLSAGAALFFFIRNLPSREKMDREAYFGLGEGVMWGLVVNGERVAAYPVRHKGAWYLPHDKAYGYVSSKLYYDGQHLLYTDALATRYAAPGESAYQDDQGLMYELDYEPCYLEDGVLYVSLDYIQLVDFSYYRVNMEEMYIWIYNDWTERDTALTKKKAVLRTAPGVKASVVEKLAEGTRVRILEEGEKWSIVQSLESGLIGSLPNGSMGDREAYAMSSPDGRSRLPYTAKMLDEPVCMAWQQVFTVSGYDNLETYLKKAEGLNVISPTWLTVLNEEGDIQSLADEAYVRMAHEYGVQVWVLMENINIEVDENLLLNVTEHRRHLVEEAVAEVRRVGADGINLDFEAVGSENGPGLLQFIRELSAACRRYGLTLSVDNYSPMPHTAFYDRAQQAEIVDYVIVMAYDEHYAGDDAAGSTSSYSWVNQSAQRTLEEVPASKLVIGLPFYTRLWKETPEAYAGEGAVLVTNDASRYGTYQLTSQGLGMEGAQQVVRDHGLRMKWLEAERQYYVEYQEEHSTYKLWIEDIRSLKEKLDASFSYHPAGVAFFRIGLETEEVWPLVGSYLR